MKITCQLLFLVICLLVAQCSTQDLIYELPVVQFTWPYTLDWKDGIYFKAKIDMISEELVMEVTMPEFSYFYVGFGGTLSETDLIVWKWNGEVTQVINMYSDENQLKSDDATDFLITTMVDTGNLKTFTTRRPLNTGFPTDFIIEPDTNILMNFGYNIGSSDIKLEPKGVLLNESVKFVTRDTNQVQDGDEQIGDCPVYDSFSKFDGTCCLLNVDCENGCCVDGVCKTNSPCPNYDGSIEKWEQEQYNKEIDELENSQQQQQETEIEDIDNVNQDQVQQGQQDSQGGNVVLTEQNPDARNRDTVLTQAESDREIKNRYKLIWLVALLLCCVLCIITSGYIARMVRQRRMAKRQQRYGEGGDEDPQNRMSEIKLTSKERHSRL